MSIFGFKKEEKKVQAPLRRPEGSESRPKASGDGAKVLPGKFNQLNYRTSHSSKDAGYSLKRPMVTEKALNLEGGRQYVFKVGGDSSKPQIKKDVENLYGVKVESVNVMNNKRRTRFMRGKVGYSPGFKKAMVKLKEGYKIEIAPR